MKVNKDNIHYIFSLPGCDTPEDPAKKANKAAFPMKHLTPSQILARGTRQISEGETCKIFGRFERPMLLP